MARHYFREIVLMVLAVLGALGILLVIGARLMHAAVAQTAAGTGGVTFVFGGVSTTLFTMLIVVVVAIVVVLAVFLWRR